MKCPCPEQQEIPDGSKFCGHCGQPLSARKSTTASFETAGEMPFADSGGADAGPTLIGSTMPEPEPEAPEAAGAAEDDDLQATLAMEALPLQPTADAESDDAGPEPVEDPEPAEEAKPSVVIDPSLTGDLEAGAPKPTELAKAVEEKPAEPEPVEEAPTVEEPAAEAPAEEAPTVEEPAAEAPTVEEPVAKEAEKKGPRKQKKAEKKKRKLQPPPEKPGAKPAPAGEKRGFRETMWFMDALDQDALSAIETEDIRDRAEKFDDDGREIEKDVRRQFSLRAGEEEEAPGRTKMRMARQKFDSAQSEASSAGGGGATVVIVLGIIAALGVAAYFLFLK